MTLMAPEHTSASPKKTRSTMARLEAEDPIRFTFYVLVSLSPPCLIPFALEFLACVDALQPFFQARSFIFGCLKVWVVAAVVIRDYASSLADSYRFGLGGLREWSP